MALQTRVVTTLSQLMRDNNNSDPDELLQYMLIEHEKLKQQMRRLEYANRIRVANQQPGIELFLNITPEQQRHHQQNTEVRSSLLEIYLSGNETEETRTKRRQIKPESAGV
jgi:DNA-binding MarR family transcriptional regulator